MKVYQNGKLSTATVLWEPHVVLLTRFLLFALAGLLFGYTDADVYLHNARGSNNRLNGNQKARQNNNRLFDSQVRLKLNITFLKGMIERVFAKSFGGVCNKRDQLSKPRQTTELSA